MKKKWMALAAALVLALMLVMPAACAIFETYSADEVFPYDVAVTRGEEGSRDDWLAGFTTPSTELRRAYEEAKADGSFTGTYFEFLKDVGAENSGEKIQSALLSVVNIYAYFEPSKSGSSNKPYYVTGSGVIYDLDTSAGDALIVTNYHIVYSATSRGDEDITHISDDITLSLYGESFSARPIKAAFVGGSMMHDIAVLRVTGCDYLNASKGEVYARKVARGDSDSVGVGSYPIDLHITTRSHSFFYAPTKPFTIPLGAMIPVRMKNLLPACKNIGTTHLTNGCFRLHPVEWNVGESCGLLAAFSLREGVSPREIRERPEVLQRFRECLRDNGIQLEW